MKKKIILVLCLAVVLTGCGNAFTEKNAAEYGGDVDYLPQTEAGYDPDGDYVNEDVAGYDYEVPATEAAADWELSDETQTAAGMAPDSVAEDNGAIVDTPKADSSQSKKLSKEMLVYRGNLSIDTLDFNKSVSDFKKLLADKGGFVESESYSDNSSTSGYYAIDENKKHNMYNATVRVPSTEYDGIMNSATDLGDVRNRTSNASNVTQQYSTYKSQLEIYEAEYKRYLSLLENAKEDEYALQIENELFDIQMRIAELKAGISNIENDVAYSYIDISIKEVSEYTAEPAKTDTFMDRLKNTCKDSWIGFLEFAEGILFYVITNIYYIVIWGVILFVIYRLIKKKVIARKHIKEQGKDIAIEIEAETVEKVEKEDSK